MDVLFPLLVAYTAVPCHAYDMYAVVNGDKAELGEFPDIVSIQKADGTHHCGGIIIDDLRILTAAHCILGVEDTELWVKYGIVDLEDSGKSILVQEKIAHEDYDPEFGIKYNDIGLMILDELIEFDEFVQPAVLPEQDEATPEDEVSILAGWGAAETGGPGQRFLQYNEMVVFPDGECEDVYDFFARREYNICSGVDGGGKGQCTGDSGGPLYVNGKLVGIVSWSMKPCGTPDYPGVFTKVSSYIDWIDEHI